MSTQGSMRDIYCPLLLVISQVPNHRIIVGLCRPLIFRSANSNQKLSVDLKPLRQIILSRVSVDEIHVILRADHPLLSVSKNAGLRSELAGYSTLIRSVSLQIYIDIMYIKSSKRVQKQDYVAKK